MRGPRILLTGHGGSSNRGCQAILQCTIGLMRKYIPGARIAVLSNDPQSDCAAMADYLDGEAFIQRRPKWPRRYSPSWLRNVVSKRLSRHQMPQDLFLNRRWYKWANVIVSIGGDNFTDCYGGPARAFEELAFARSMGVRTVIWAASIGPFRAPHDESRWTDELKKVDLITAREDLTLKYLRERGVINNVARVADPAFLLPPREANALRFGRRPGRALVGVGMSALIGRYGVSQEHYFDAVSAFAASLLEEGLAELVLVPHVTKDTPGDDDQRSCAQLAERLGNPDRVFVVDRRHGAEEMKYAISQCDYFIGARTHSTIASLSSCVPTLSIAYSRKAYGLNMDIFGHTRYVVPVEDITADKLMSGYRTLTRERGEIVSRLESSIPSLRDAAESGGKLLQELCGAPAGRRAR